MGWRHWELCRESYRFEPEARRHRLLLFGSPALDRPKSLRATALPRLFRHAAASTSDTPTKTNPNTPAHPDLDGIWAVRPLYILYVQKGPNQYLKSGTMTSLKRSLGTDPHASNISSKVFVRSTRSGKVQKIVRELYLRQDIPCSSKLCRTCQGSAPADANGVGKPFYTLQVTVARV